MGHITPHCAGNHRTKEVLRVQLQASPGFKIAAAGFSSHLMEPHKFRVYSLFARRSAANSEPLKMRKAPGQLRPGAFPSERE